MTRDVKAFARDARKLPALPTLHYELSHVVQDPESSMDEVVTLLERDQSLAARLLRLSNSSFYGFPYQIATLMEAVQLIGLAEVQDLVLATTVIKAFDKVPAHLVDVTSFWKHSIACGLASASLARLRNDPVPERLFLGGLLHDIGRLQMFLEAPAESAEILERCERDQALASPIEEEVLGFDHTMLGAELVTVWRLPLPLREMVRGHHDPRLSTVTAQDTFLVHYADFIISALDYGKSGELFLSPLIPPAESERFLLEEGSIRALVADVDQRCEEIFPILNSARGV